MGAITQQPDYGSNSNKITPNLRSICLKSQLLGHDYDHFSKEKIDVILSESGASAIVAAINIRDPWYVKNAVLKNFDYRITVQLKFFEICKDYEARFLAQVAKLHSHSSSIQLYQSILSMIPFSCSNINYVASQRHVVSLRSLSSCYID